MSKTTLSIIKHPLAIILLFTIHYSLFTIHCVAQDNAAIFGKVANSESKALEMVNVSVFNSPGGTVTDKEGKYFLTVPAGKKITIVYSCIGYKTDTINITLKHGEKKEINKTLSSKVEKLNEVEVEDMLSRSTELVRINPTSATVIPSEIGGIEALIKTLPGVSSRNEMSSQYSVRGGNFDENLVYVNDIEIYRPLLINQGQQEGLSFINPDLVSSVQFSAGGFEPKYGDKMSSVLDIQYKKPTEFGGSVSMSLLGGTAHIEGTADSNRLTYILGIRQKSNQYLLNGLETKGDYNPSFADVQAYINYTLSKKWNIDFLANYSSNHYTFIPQSRQTQFGTMQEALRLNIYFDGQEVDAFDTYFGAVSATFKPSDKLKLKFIASAFNDEESQTFDILGQYYLSELNSNGNIISNLGVGSFLDHERDFLNADVYSFEHKGAYSSSFFQPLEWGVKYNREIINDQLNEWNFNDSAEYSLPRPPDFVGYTVGNNGLIYYNNNVYSSVPSKLLLMNGFVNSENNLISNRVSGFIQNRWNFKGNSTDISLVAGFRAEYWDVNKQFLFGPRATLSYMPTNWKNDILFRFSTGYYYQPPFFKELIDSAGVMHKDVKAQTSIHVVGAMDWNFKAWNRPFKFITEVYYKYLYDLIPYEVDDVRIRYYAGETANGYATGIDFKVNGEFVKGLESWGSMSIMQTMEKINGDTHGYIPRPTDQRVSFGMFFQDYLPMNPTYKVYLNFLYGSGLPFGPPDSPPYDQVLRMPSYLRVDIGFSKQLKSENNPLSKKNPFRFFKNIWITFEVFNLLDANNTISYTWVKDVNNQEFAVPNYLTPREPNLKLSCDF